MKIGVIGLGSIGSKHYSNLDELGHQVIGFDPAVRMDIKLERLVYDECDAIVVATPSAFHSGPMRASIERSKHVLVEKPITLSSPEVAASLIEYAQRKNVTLMVAYNLRFHACVKKAKEWIGAGKIGKPMWANFTCGQFSSKPSYLRDGVVLNWSHEIDLALHLLGPGHLEASSVRIIDGHDDMADILMTHESGCRSSIHLDYITTPEQRHFTIQGDEGQITCSLTGRNLFLRTQKKDDAEWYLGKGSYDTDYMDEMKAFIDRIEGKETPGCTGAEAIKVLEICLEVRRQAGL